MKTLTLTAVAAAFVSTLAVVPASAQDVRLAVSYVDLDITSANGATALASRIQTGIDKACARATDIRSLKSIELCRDALTADAVAQLADDGAPLAAQSLAAKG